MSGITKNQNNCYRANNADNYQFEFESNTIERKGKTLDKHNQDIIDSQIDKFREANNLIGVNDRISAYDVQKAKNDKKNRRREKKTIRTKGNDYKMSVANNELTENRLNKYSFDSAICDWDHIDILLYLLQDRLPIERYYRYTHGSLEEIVYDKHDFCELYKKRRYKRKQSVQVSESNYTDPYPEQYSRARCESDEEERVYDEHDFCGYDNWM